MTGPSTPEARLARFVARVEALGRATVWSDRTDHAVPLRLDDLRALLAATPLGGNGSDAPFDLILTPPPEVADAGGS